MPKSNEQIHIDSDSLSRDIIRIVEKTLDAGEVKLTELVSNLVIYIVDRDHKVFDHAFKLGKGDK